jgi:uncharacterized membrane protein YoaK (UPF0700 family)
MSTAIVPATAPATINDRELRYARARNWLLDGLTLSSGAVDAISFLGLGKVFTAFMTGNVAFLGMAIASQTGVSAYGVTPPRALSVLASLAGFMVGVFIGTRIVASKKPAAHDRKQTAAAWWPHATTVALGVSLLAHLCFAAIWYATDARPGDTAIPVLLAVWAVAMGLQSAAVRKLDLGGIFTTAATGTVIVLASDLVNFRATAAERRRARGVLISLVIGATAGGLLLIHAPVYAPMFSLVVTAFVVATGARVFRNHEVAEEARLAA